MLRFTLPSSLPRKSGVPWSPLQKFQSILACQLISLFARGYYFSLAFPGKPADAIACGAKQADVFLALRLLGFLAGWAFADLVRVCCSGIVSEIPLCRSCLQRCSRLMVLVSFSESLFLRKFLSCHDAVLCLQPLDRSWRWMLGVGAIPPIVILCSLIVMPESPRWLVKHGHSGMVCLQADFRDHG